MHARRNPLISTVVVGTHHVVVLVGVFLFALAMTTSALQGSDTQTVEISYPNGPQPATVPTVAVAPAR